MSTITKTLHAAYQRELTIDDLFSQVRRTLDPIEKRALLAKIDALRAERHPAMVAWLAAVQAEEDAA